MTENGKLALSADNTLTATLLQQVLQFNKIRKLQEPVRIIRKEQELIVREIGEL